jgi:AcrR family transcriptional regulator
MSGKTPRERRHARTRQAILDAAREIITEQGSGGLSMRELAQRIEYSPSGLYEYFSSKEELIEEVCNEGFSALSQRMTGVPRALPPAERLTKAALVYLAFAADHPEEYLLMFNQVPPAPFSPDDLLPNSAYGQLRQIVQDGIDAGDFKSLPDFGLEEMTYQCWALVHGMAMLRLTLFRQSADRIDALNRQALAGAITKLGGS